MAQHSHGPFPDAWNGAKPSGPAFGRPKDKLSGRRSGIQRKNLPRSGACFFLSGHADLGHGAARLDLHAGEPAKRHALRRLGDRSLLRIYEHKEKLRPGFTSRYEVTMPVWYEGYPRIIEARHREYAIKKWRRAWNIALIEATNPDWRDLYDDLNSKAPAAARSGFRGSG